jgi:hypothetical protein
MIWEGTFEIQEAIALGSILPMEMSLPTAGVPVERA